MHHIDVKIYIKRSNSKEVKKKNKDILFLIHVSDFI